MGKVSFDEHDGKIIIFETHLWAYKSADWQIEDIILDAHSIKRVFNPEKYKHWLANPPKEDSGCNIF